MVRLYPSRHLGVARGKWNSGPPAPAHICIIALPNWFRSFRSSSYYRSLSKPDGCEADLPWPPTRLAWSLTFGQHEVVLIQSFPRPSRNLNVQKPEYSIETWPGSSIGSWRKAFASSIKTTRARPSKERRIGCMWFPEPMWTCAQSQTWGVSISTCHGHAAGWLLTRPSLIRGEVSLPHHVELLWHEDRINTLAQGSSSADIAMFRHITWSPRAGLLSHSGVRAWMLSQVLYFRLSTVLTCYKPFSFQGWPSARWSHHSIPPSAYISKRKQSSTRNTSTPHPSTSKCWDDGIISCGLQEKEDASY